MISTAFRKSIVGFAAVLGLLASPAFAANLVVEPGDDVQAIIDSAVDGDTVQFMAGTYSGQFSIHSNITLTSSGATVQGQFSIYGDNVVIDSFSMKAGDSGLQYGILIKSGASHAVIRNNTIEGFQVGVGIGSNNSTVQNNTISNNWWGIFTNDATGDSASEAVIDSNVIHDNSVGGIGLVNNEDATLQTRITNNSLSRNATGIRLSNADTITITGNTILDSSNGGGTNASIELLGATGNIQITDNQLAGGSYGIQIRNNNSNIEIHQNQILDFSTAGLFVQQNPAGVAAYATCNFWGDDSGPYNALTNPNGKGSKVTGDVDVASDAYTPWTLSGGTCSGTPGPGPGPTPDPGLDGIWQERNGNRCIQISKGSKVAETYKKCGPLTCKRSVGVIRPLTDDEPWVARILYPGIGLISQELAPIGTNRMQVREEYHFGPIQYSKRRVYRKVDRCRYHFPIHIPKPHPKPKPTPPTPTPSATN